MDQCPATAAVALAAVAMVPAAAMVVLKLAQVANIPTVILIVYLYSY
jgi:hypothetical protein